MAGGTSIWASKDAKSDPREIFNLRLLYLLVTLAWAGCFYGFDTGNIGGILTLPSFEKAFGLYHVNWCRELSLPWSPQEAPLDPSSLHPRPTG